MIKINIKTLNISLDDPLYEYIYNKIGGLEKFIMNIDPNFEIEARVEVGKNNQHHHKGQTIWRAEVNIPLPGKLVRSSVEDWDLRVAIDKVKDELQLELKKYKGINDAKYKKGARVLKNLMRLSPLSWFKREKGEQERNENT